MNRDVIYRLQNALDLLIQASEQIVLHIEGGNKMQPVAPKLQATARLLMEAQTTVDTLESFV